MKSRQVDRKSTFQVRLDKGWQEILFSIRGKRNMSIKALVEEALSDWYVIEKHK